MPIGRNPLEGLTDFGMSEPSQSNSVGSDTPDLDSLLAGMPEDVKKLTGPAINEFARASLLRDEIEKLENTPVPSKKDLLITPASIAKLLGAGAAAAFGGPEGLALALGLTAGTVKKAEQLQTLKQEAKNTQIEAKHDQLKESQELIDKQQTRIAGMLNANPEVFVGPEGDPVSPEAIGWLTTGVNLPVFPHTRAIVAKRKENWEKHYNFLNDALKQARNPEDARVLVDNMFQHLGMEKVPPGLTDAMVNSLGTPEQEPQLVNTIMRYGGFSGLQAWKFAAENKLPISDPQVLSKIQFTDTDATQPSQQLNARMLDVMDRVNKWAKENPNQYKQIQDEAGDMAEESRLVAKAALGDTPADEAFYIDKNNIPADMTVAALQRGYGVVDNELGILNIMSGGQAARQMKGATPENIRTYKGNAAVDFVKGLQQEAKNNNARRVATMRNKKRMDIKNRLPNANDGTINEILNTAFEEAITNIQPAGEDKPVDVNKLEVEIDKVLLELYKEYGAE